MNIFVYGTLMRGHARADLLAGATDVTPASTHGRLYHLPYGYPALIDSPDGRVHGELVVMPDLDGRLETLDDYEGDLYRRVRREVRCERRGAVEAWCYVVDRDHEAVLVADGAVFLANGRWEAS